MTRISRPSIANGSASAATILCASTAAPCGILQPGLHQRELVAAEARERVALADRRAQPLGDRAQEAVAAGVAEAVVDLLEVVEIEHHHGDPAALAARLAHRLAQAVEQQRAVGQAGQRVVMGEMADLLLDALALGDVEQHELGRGLAALADRHRDRLDVDAAARRDGGPQLARPPARARRRARGR